MGFNRFFLVFDKLERFVEKREFKYEEAEEAKLYVRHHTRKGLRVEETRNIKIYEKY